MAVYAIARIEKIKMGTVGRIYRHHERKKESYKSNPDIDPTRTRFNFHLVEPSGPYMDMVRQRIQAAGARRRKDSVVMQDGLVAATPEWIKAKTPEAQQEFFRYAFRFFEERFGKENMISAVVHMDEATPHMHFCFVPITKKGRLSSKDVIGGPRGMHQLQEDYYAYMVEKYPELSRGIPKRVSRRTHLPGYIYKNAAQLHSHYEEIVTAIQNIGLVGNARKKEQALELLGRYAPEMARLKNDVRQTDRHIFSLEQQLKDSDWLLNDARALNLHQEQELYRERQKIRELSRQQKKLMEQLALVPPELMDRLIQQEMLRRRQQQQKNIRKGR